jgi:SAM-dependent methyltransferase
VRDLLLGQVYWLPTPPGRLLDVGCGDGRHLRLLRTLGWEVLGIDTDGAAAEVARKTFGLDVRTSTMRELPEAWFDAVVLHHVFEHVLDPDETLRDIRRVLRPGGRCIIVTPNGASLAQRLFGRSWVHWDPPRHLQVFVPTSLRTVLARHRFSRIDVRTTARNARFAWSASTGIRLSANERTGAGAPPLLRRISGLGFQVVESLALTVNGHLGEELVAVAYAD